MLLLILISFFFFFNDTATTEIYTLSLHDALPISPTSLPAAARRRSSPCCSATRRSEEHTSELQSPTNLVCRLLLEKKKKCQHSSICAGRLWCGTRSGRPLEVW